MLHPCLYSGYFVASGLQLAITSSILRSRTLALTCYAWLLKVSNGTCTPLGYLLLRNGSLSVGNSRNGVAGSRRAGIRSCLMTKKFARRAGLIQVILQVLTAALRLAKVVLEILDKVANCDARKLQTQVYVPR